MCDRRSINGAPKLWDPEDVPTPFGDKCLMVHSLDMRLIIIYKHLQSYSITIYNSLYVAFWGLSFVLFHRFSMFHKLF